MVPIGLLDAGINLQFVKDAPPAKHNETRYACTYFCYQKKIQRGFSLLQKRQTVLVLQQSHSRGSGHPEQQEGCQQAPSPGTPLSISAPSSGGPELHLGASVLCLYLFCASVSKLCPTLTE